MKRSKEIHTISPWIFEDSKVLILGSFPSQISRKESMYYGNPQNRFWKVMEELFKDKVDVPIEFCERHQIALWDVIGSCVIEGSSDASIQDIIYNPIDEIIEKYPIHCIILNGKKASSEFHKQFFVEIPVYDLPSTSSANARYSLDDLVNEYSKIKEYL